MNRRWGLVLLAMSGVAAAGPAEYVFEPSFEPGEFELEVIGGWARESDAEAHEMGFGIGRAVAWWWSTELFAHLEGGSDQGTELEAFEWENRFLLTRPGSFPVDFGLVAELEIPRESSEPREVVLGAMVQRRFGLVQANLNVLLERPFGGDDPEKETELGYQWQLSRPVRPAVALGLQGFGELGEWNNWAGSDQQSHIAGPAIFGRLPFGEDGLELNAAWLIGMNAGAADHTLRFQLEMEL